jgi:hypothetical protein
VRVALRAGYPTEASDLDESPVLDAPQECCKTRKTKSGPACDLVQRGVVCIATTGNPSVHIFAEPFSRASHARRSSAHNTPRVKSQRRVIGQCRH